MGTVLTVDDHLDTCHLVERLVRHLGHDVTCVESGGAAIAFLARRIPDLVILDVRMDGMSGLDVLGRMRDGLPTRDVPVVMYSAHDDDDLRRRCAALGASGYLLKNGTKLGLVEPTLRRLLPAGAGNPAATS